MFDHPLWLFYEDPIFLLPLEYLDKVKIDIKEVPFVYKVVCHYIPEIKLQTSYIPFFIPFEKLDI